MGLNLNQSSNKVYVSMLNGKMTIPAKPDDEKAKKVEVKNPQTGQTITKYVHEVFSITGVIQSVSLKEKEIPNTGKKYKEIHVSIKDGNEEFVLTTKFKTDQGISLVNRLAGFVRLNLGQIQLTVGAYKMQNTETGRFNQGFYIHYGDSIKVELPYKRENLPPETQWKQVERNGEMEWDKTGYLKFFMKVLTDDVIPYFENLKKLNENIPVEDSFDDVEDMIF